MHARRRTEPSPEPAIPWNRKQTISSALLYTLAFNLTFFIQELFLVLPKALTAGVRPTLFHRIPRELTEVVGPPAVVTLVGVVWVQAGAWRFNRVSPQGEAGVGSIAYPLSAALLLLLVFQLVLRPDIRFY